MLDPTFTSAVVYSCQITLLTIGFTLGYLTAKVPNFAHGTIASIGAYVAFTWYLWGYSPYLATPIAFVLTALVCLAIYRFVLCPLSHLGATSISLMISTIAIEMIVLAFLNIYADYLQFQRLVASRFFILRSVDFQALGLPGIFLVSICAALLCIILLHTMLTKTRFGISMRATVEDPDLASTMGVNVESVCAVSWFLTGGLAGLAGCLFSLWFQVDPNTGSTLILTVFAASVLGGLTSIYGAIAGGFAMAFAEVYVTSVLADVFGAWVIGYGLLVPLVVMSIVLLTFPRGIAELVSGLYWQGRLASQSRKNRGD
jgi:branched-chain amino acid transport system permease protein